MGKRLLSIKKRKQLHLEYALQDDCESGSTGLEQVRLPYHALGERDLEEVDLSTEFLGKEVGAPLFISCMTGGPEKAGLINRRLAKAAQKYRIPMGLGSLKIVLKHPEVLPSFQVRKYAPDIVLMANLGAVSLNYGLTWKDCQQVVDLVVGDALVLHLNPLQEALQMGGDTNFSDLLPKIEEVVKKLSVPLIVKEVGHGIDYQTAKQLFEAGVKVVDTAGVGGTSWAWIEAMIAGDEQRAKVFKDYGLSTYDSVNECLRVKGLTVLGSGGIRSGLDIAKVLQLGCKMAGMGRPFLLAALKSEKSVEELIERLTEELRVVEYCGGSKF